MAISSGFLAPDGAHHIKWVNIVIAGNLILKIILIPWSELVALSPLLHSAVVRDALPAHYPAGLWLHHILSQYSVSNCSMVYCVMI